jgi:dUTPase
MNRLMKPWICNKWFIRVWFKKNVLESVTILPMKIEIIPTGLFFNIPDNHEIQIRPRSGLASKLLRY